MTPGNQRVSAWIAVVILALATCFVVALAISASRFTYLESIGSSGDVRLTPLWRSATFFMKNGVLANTIFASFLSLVSILVTTVSKVYKRTPEVAIISVLCLIGIAAATFAMIEVCRPSASDKEPSPIALLDLYGDFGRISEDIATDWVQAFFGGLIGWFTIFLATVLGIRLLRGKETTATPSDQSPAAAPSAPSHASPGDGQPNQREPGQNSPDHGNIDVYPD